MAGKRRRPAPRRKARSAERKQNRVMPTVESHHDRNPGGWMPQATMPRFMRRDRTFLPLDWGEDDPSINFDHWESA